MKLSSCIALGVLAANRFNGNGKTSLSDGICTALLAKNEVLDHDGALHPTQASPEELAQRQVEMEEHTQRLRYERAYKEEKKRREIEKNLPLEMKRRNQGGFWGGFWNSYYDRERQKYGLPYPMSDE